jgi:hypothetical protein
LVVDRLSCPIVDVNNYKSRDDLDLLKSNDTPETNRTISSSSGTISDNNSNENRIYSNSFGEGLNVQRSVNFGDAMGGSSHGGNYYNMDAHKAWTILQLSPVYEADLVCVVARLARCPQ